MTLRQVVIDEFEILLNPNHTAYHVQSYPVATNAAFEFEYQMGYDRIPRRMNVRYIRDNKEIYKLCVNYDRVRDVVKELTRMYKTLCNTLQMDRAKGLIE